MSTAPAAAPRRAASVLVLRDDPFEVLMVRRNARQSFASALVFPGGAVEPTDASEAWRTLVAPDDLAAEERALRIAALREVHEECGVFLGPLPKAAPASVDFRALAAQAGAPLALDRLVAFGHWITPAHRAKRFDTHFFLARMPAGQQARADGSETVALEWVSPAALLDQVARGESQLLFPTLMNLKRLAESDSVADAVDRARMRKPFTVEPVLVPTEDGIEITIPEEAGYGETRFRVPPSTL
ncbi:NUDIX hydrolase [Sphingomonas azotifigens]|uniref:NUDIX hydrolase n=1 Tax=Sphingomonas azotifigens TaxID=330920 RepID=UPI00142F78D2|nr:NUDIX hydrolase [Sphingomonas azotifigens]